MQSGPVAQARSWPVADDQRSNRRARSLGAVELFWKQQSVQRQHIQLRDSTAASFASFGARKFAVDVQQTVDSMSMLTRVVACGGGCGRRTNDTGAWIIWLAVKDGYVNIYIYIK